MKTRPILKQLNKTLKQQSEPIAATFERLRREGFDAKAARAIASSYPAERVERQIRWLDRRTIKTNRLGLLRAAIEQDWAAPGAAVGTAGQGKLGRPNSSERPAGTSYADALSQVRNRFINKPNSSTP
jgi:hypothetical protein